MRSVMLKVLFTLVLIAAFCYLLATVLGYQVFSFSEFVSRLSKVDTSTIDFSFENSLNKLISSIPDFLFWLRDILKATLLPLGWISDGVLTVINFILGILKAFFVPKPESSAIYLLLTMS